MTTLKISKNQLLELVKESLEEYEVFFDDIPLDEKITLDMLVSSVYDMANSLDHDKREISLLTSTCVLVYENFKLNFKKENNGNR